MVYVIILAIIGVNLLANSCYYNHRNHNHDHNTLQPAEQITVAKAQKEIKLGMSSSAVVEALGSPNMVTTDSQRRETWVYDKVSTEVSSSRSGRGVWLLIFGGSSSQNSASSNQKTLTIIVKFDEKSEVRDFSYRTSSF